MPGCTAGPALSCTPQARAPREGTTCCARKESAGRKTAGADEAPSAVARDEEPGSACEASRAQGLVGGEGMDLHVPDARHPGREPLGPRVGVQRQHAGAGEPGGELAREPGRRGLGEGREAGAHERHARHRPRRARARGAVQEGLEPLAHAPRHRLLSEPRHPGALGGDHLLAQGGVAGEHREQPRHLHGLVREGGHARAAHRLGHGGGAIRDHGHAAVHGLEQGHAKALVPAHGDVGRGRREARGELRRAHPPEQSHALGPEHLLETMQVGPVGRLAVEVAGDDEAAVRLVQALEGGEDAEHVIHALAGHGAAHEEQIDTPVLQLGAQHRVRRHVEGAPVHREGQHRHARVARRHQLLGAEARVAPRALHQGPHREQLVPGRRARHGHLALEALEERGGRHVVVHERLASRRALEQGHQPRLEAVVDEQGARVVRLARVVAGGAHQGAALLVPLLGVDVRGIPPAAQEVAQVAHLIAHGIAPRQARHQLMDRPGPGGIRPPPASGYPHDGLHPLHYAGDECPDHRWLRFHWFQPRQAPAPRAARLDPRQPRQAHVRGQPGELPVARGRPPARLRTGGRGQPRAASTT